MKNIVKSSLSAFLLLFANFLFANISLTEHSKISLITCGSGEELYSIFGHSAIRISDTTNGMDIVFNYGTFNFEEEGFYVKFVRGKLNYELSVSSFPRFIESYIEEDRFVNEQVLNLTLAEKQNLFDYLADNYEPENRFYKYDFFFDNCSTKIRDILSNAIGKNLIWNNDTKNQVSFRKMLDPYIVTMPWVKAGFYLGLGRVTDKIPNSYQTMFLPNELEAGVSKAMINNGKLLKPLVISTNQLYKKKFAKTSKTVESPMMIGFFMSLIVLIMTVLEYFGKIKMYSFDRILWLKTAVIGFLIIFLWFFTDHVSTKINLNLAWASPLWILALLFNKKSNPAVLKQMFLILTVFSFLSIVCVFVSGQAFHPLWICFAFILLLRGIANYIRLQSSLLD